MARSAPPAGSRSIHAAVVVHCRPASHYARPPWRRWFTRSWGRRSRSTATGRRCASSATAAGRRSTWSSYGRDVRRAARALIKLGVQPGQGRQPDRGRTAPSGSIADVGAIFAGAMPAGIYTTNSAEQVRYITDHCEAKVSFADTAAQVAKFVAEKDRLPRLEVVVQMHGKPAADAGGGKLRVLGWEEFLDARRRRARGRPRGAHEGAEARRRLHAHLHVGHDR